jgi:hypothetical protein
VTRSENYDVVFALAHAPARDRLNGFSVLISIIVLALNVDVKAPENSSRQKRITAGIDQCQGDESAPMTRPLYWLFKTV